MSYVIVIHRCEGLYWFYKREARGRYAPEAERLLLWISLRFERAWSVSVGVIKLLPLDSEHASRLRTRITLTHVRSEVKSTVNQYRPTAQVNKHFLDHVVT